MNTILDMIDAADEGSISLPKPARDLALTTAKDTHSWMIDSRPSALELQERSSCLNSLITEIARKGIAKELQS